MSARPIKDLIAPILQEAVGLTRLQAFIACLDDMSERKQFIMLWHQYGVISPAETELLIEFNQLEAA